MANKKNINIPKDWKLIDEDRYTFVKENEDGGYTFVGLTEISDDDDFVVQTGTYNASDELEQDMWGVASIVYEEGYGLDPDEEMTREEWLDYLERHYGNNVELVIDKCLFWQDYNNEDICEVHGWEKACTKVEGLLHIY